MTGAEYGDIEIRHDDRLVELLDFALRAAPFIQHGASAIDHGIVRILAVDRACRYDELPWRRYRHARGDNGRLTLTVQRGEIPQPSGHAARDRLEQDFDDAATALPH